MTSRPAVRAVTARLLDLPGVQWVQADPTTALLVVNGTVHGTDIQCALTEIGHLGVDFGKAEASHEGTMCRGDPNRR